MYGILPAASHNLPPSLKPTSNDQTNPEGQRSRCPSHTGLHHSLWGGPFASDEMSTVVLSSRYRGVPSALTHGGVPRAYAARAGNQTAFALRLATALPLSDQSLPRRPPGPVKPGASFHPGSGARVRTPVLAVRLTACDSLSRTTSSAVGPSVRLAGKLASVTDVAICCSRPDMLLWYASSLGPGMGWTAIL